MIVMELGLYAQLQVQITCGALPSVNRLQSYVPLCVGVPMCVQGCHHMFARNCMCACVCICVFKSLWMIALDSCFVYSSEIQVTIYGHNVNAYSSVWIDQFPACVVQGRQEWQPTESRYRVSTETETEGCTNGIFDILL